MKTLKLSSAILWAILMIVFYFPHYAYADILYSSTGTVDPQGVGALSSNFSPYTTGTVDQAQLYIAFYAPDGDSNGTEKYELYDVTNSLDLDCQTAAQLPSAWESQGAPTFSNSASISWGVSPVTMSFSGTQCTATSTNSYRIKGIGGSNPDAAMGYIQPYISSPTWMIIGSGALVDTSTHIINVTPAASSTIATSSTATFGATVNINAADYAAGMYVQIKYAHEAQGTLTVEACTDCLFTTITFPITQSGISSFSTTSPATAVGRYVMVSTIRNASLIDNALQFLGFGQFATLGVKTSTTTTFVAGARNAYDILTDNMVQSINDYLASSTVSFASCTNWTQLSLVDCMNLLFVPQWAPIKDAVDNFRTGFLTYWPWGYITRFAVIMSGSSTSTLPAFAVGFQNVLPPGGPTDTYTLDMNDMLAGGASALDSVPARGGTANEKDILEPILRTFLALLIVIMIVRDLTKIGSAGHHNSAGARGHV